MAGKARLGAARPGWARQGKAWRGRARRGEAGRNGWPRMANDDEKEGMPQSVAEVPINGGKSTSEACAMTTFLLVYFWLALFINACRAMGLILNMYPKTETTTVSGALGSTLLNMPMLLWCAWLLWGNGP